MRTDPIRKIDLSVTEELLPKFFQLLEQGFILETVVGGSLRDFLCGRVGIDAQYLENRVQTIFLDHNPVDDPDSAVIRAGSNVALSAAMPGLVGATLRKAGRFAAMRNQISRRTEAARTSDQRTLVTVKFFNMVARDLGEKRLREGVRIPGSNFAWFVEKYGQVLQAHLRSARLDGKTIGAPDLAAISAPGGLLLTVSAA